MLFRSPDRRHALRVYAARILGQTRPPARHDVAWEIYRVEIMSDTPARHARGLKNTYAVMPSFQPNHIPPWLTVSGDLSEFDRRSGILWDHWGSVIIDGELAIITQPYRRSDDSIPSRKAQENLAVKFAEEHSCAVEILDRGVWHEKTCMFIFSKKSKI